MDRIVEALAARYGRTPLEIADIPMKTLIEWYDAAIENLADEGAISIGGALGKLLK